MKRLLGGLDTRIMQKCQTKDLPVEKKSDLLRHNHDFDHVVWVLEHFVYAFKKSKKRYSLFRNQKNCSALKSSQKV